MRLYLLSVLPLLALYSAPASAQTTVSLGLRVGGNYATRSGATPAHDVRINSGAFGFISQSKTQEYTRAGVFAAQFGAVLDVRFGRFALQPAMLLSQKGADQQSDVVITVNEGSSSPTIYTESQHIVSRPNYLEIPINLVFTSHGDHGFQVFGGPYAAFGVGGQGQTDVEGSVTDRSGVGSYGPYSSGKVTYSGYGFNVISYRNEYPAALGNPFTPANPFTANAGAYIARRFDAGLNAGIGYRRGPLQVQLAYGLGLINQQPGKGRGLTDDLPAYYQRVTQLTATYFMPFRAAPTPSPQP